MFDAVIIMIIINLVSNFHDNADEKNKQCDLPSCAQQKKLKRNSIL